jgi:hypothetical protein
MENNMKLLTRLREQRAEKPLDEIFEKFQYTLESYHFDAVGIGATSHEDIARLNIENNYADFKYQP